MSPARKHIRLTMLNVVWDAVAIALSFAVAYFFRFFSGIIPSHHHPQFPEYARTLVVIIPVCMFFLRSYKLYQPVRHIRRIEEIFQVMKAITFAVLVLTALTFFYRGLSYSRIYLVMFWITCMFLVSFFRYFLIQWEYSRKLRRMDITRVLLVGANRNARSIAQWAKNNPHYGHEIVGVLAHDTALVGKHLEGHEIIGISDQCEAFIKTLRPDQVVLVDPVFPRDKITDLVVECEDRMIEFKVGADFYGIMSRNVAVEYMSTIPLLGFQSLPLDDFWNRAVKRTFDITVSLCMILISLPFWLFLMILIKLDDGGPVLYRQERVGRDQRVFRLLKFRTMKVDAERFTGPVWANPKDNRRTRMGGFLRRWNLDELPQLLNVLAGEMSLVGPRPERPHFVSQFREAIPRYMARHKIKSGLTGWAQVHGYRGNTSILERTKYDLYYMENWSLMLDIEILIMTMFAFKNAY